MALSESCLAWEGGYLFCHRQGYFTYSLLKGVLGIVHQLVISAFIGYYKGFILDFLAV